MKKEDKKGMIMMSKQITYLSEEKELNPSLHIFPLEPKTLKPIILKQDKIFGIAGITEDARISVIPIFKKKHVDKFCKELVERIEDRYIRYPDPNAVQFIAFGVGKCPILVGKEKEKPEIEILIYEVHAFNRIIPEFILLYYSVLQQTTGKLQSVMIDGESLTPAFLEENVKSQECKNWINSLIEFLKKEYNWAEYVNKAFEDKMNFLGYRHE